MLHFPLILITNLNKTESAVFKFCRLSLFLKDRFSRLFENSDSMIFGEFLLFKEIFP